MNSSRFINGHLLILFVIIWFIFSEITLDKNGWTGLAWGIKKTKVRKVK